MKNIIFDLGGVLFGRDINKSSLEFRNFFQFIRLNPMPPFWENYDRGTSPRADVVRTLALINDCSLEKANKYLQQAIDMQEPVTSTEQLIKELKKAGYKLYVLSNMSREFIAFLRKFSVYSLFDGDVVSCEYGVAKPETAIYRILLDRYHLKPAETFFIDDRKANIAAAAELGIKGYLFNPANPADSCEQLRLRLLPATSE